LVRYEALGPDRYEAEEHELSVVGVRSGDRVMVGDRIVVTIDDVAILRRTVYARRVVPEAVLRGIEGSGRGKKRGKAKEAERSSRGRERSSRGGGRPSKGQAPKKSGPDKRRKRR
jgi:ribonuclease R